MSRHAESIQPPVPRFRKGYRYQEHWLEVTSSQYGHTTGRTVYEATEDGHVESGFGTSIEDALADLLRQRHAARMREVYGNEVD